jgi:Trk K+ transport system NAD-binding subunit
MIIYSHPLYDAVRPWLGVFERRSPKEPGGGAGGELERVSAVVFGLGRFGSGIVGELRARGARVIGVDFNPETVRRRECAADAVLYGDAEDPEFLATLPLARTDSVVSTLRERDVNMALLHGLKHQAYAGKVAVTAESPADVERYRQAGADVAFLPYADAAVTAVDRLLDSARVKDGGGTLGRPES